MPDMMIKCLDCGLRYNKDWDRCPRCKLSEFTSSVPSPEEEKLIASESKSQAVNQYEFSPIEEYLPNKFNEPSHYHTHEIDTIQFLQGGFPPSVFKGFAVGSAVKYLHRYENKNGIEDLVKAKDYIERLIKFHEEKDPLE